MSGEVIVFGWLAFWFVGALWIHQETDLHPLNPFLLLISPIAYPTWGLLAALWAWATGELDQEQPGTTRPDRGEEDDDEEEDDGDDNREDDREDDDQEQDNQPAGGQNNQWIRRRRRRRRQRTDREENIRPHTSTDWMDHEQGRR